MNAEAARASGPLGFRARLLASLVAGLLLAAAVPRPAGAVAAVAENGLIQLHYAQTPLSQVVAEIARATGKRIVVDPALPGRFTITMHRLVSPEEALALLDATLTMQGYALMRGRGDVYRVLPVTVASSGAPWTGLAALEERDQLVTTMMDVHEVDAASLAAKIQPQVSKDDLVVPYPDTNSLILVGNEKRLLRTMALIQALDAGGSGELWLRTLRHRGVQEVADMLPEVVAPSFGEGELRFWTDERTNTLILLGTDDQLQRAAKFIDELDRPVEVSTKLRVVRVRNRDAQEIQEMLLALAVGRVLKNREAAAAQSAPPRGLPGVSTEPPGGENLMGKNFVAMVDPGTNSLIIDADRDTFRTIQTVIDYLDREQPRIQVDVTGYEITNPSSMSLGVDFFLPILEPNKDGSGNFLSVTSNPSGGGLRGEIGPDISFFGRASRDPLLIPFVDANGQPVQVVVPRETVVVQADDRAVRTRVLLNPRLLMSSGEEQRIFVGQNVPILVGQSAESLQGVQTRNQVERQDVGVELRVLPQLGDSGEVTLKLHIEVSRIGPSVAGNVNLVGPTVEKRLIETKIPMADGELAVVGMSQDGLQTSSQSGTPFLQDIPILGYLVKSQSSRTNDTHLIFAVQAKILRSHDEDIAESIRQRLALERSQSRLKGVRMSSRFPYALLLSTVSDRGEAQEIADGFEREGADAQVGSWMRGGQELFDVYLTGYRKMALAGADALRLRERGFAPQVVVMPGAVQGATAPGVQLLGSDLDSASED